MKFDDLFLSISNELNNEGGVHLLSSEFAKLKENSDRIHFVAKLPVLNQFTSIDPDYTTKSVEQSEQYRSHGNKSFKESDYYSALSFYTQAIMFAPSDSRELALAYANRSAVLLRQKHFLECLHDIESSLTTHYPEDLCYKLHERRGKCFSNLGEHQQALNSYKDALTRIESSILREDKRSSLKIEINSCIQELEHKLRDLNINESRRSSDEILQPRVTGNLNQIFPCASDTLTVLGDLNRGRYAVAAKDVNMGDILIVEEPFSSILFPEFYLSHCHHCCARIIRGIPCHQCSSVLFCGRQCREVSWTNYHSAECLYLNYLNGLDIGLPLLALRMIIQIGSQNILRYYDDKSNISTRNLYKYLGSDSIFRSNDYKAALSLVDHAADRTVADLFYRTVQAVLLLGVVMKIETPTTKGALVSNESSLHIIGGFLLQFILMLPCNAHEITELCIDSRDVLQSTNIEIGSALYNTLSLLNHSCDPSVVRTSYKNTCVLRTVRPLHKGEEICDSYSMLYATSDKNERQSHLLKQYYFTCQCLPCVNGWPLYNDLPSDNPIYLCNKCKCILYNSKSGRVQCEQCNSLCDIDDINKLLKSCSKKCDIILEKIIAGNKVEGNLPFLYSYLEILAGNIRRPWKRFNDVQEIIKRIFALMGNSYTKPLSV